MLWLLATLAAGQALIDFDNAAQPCIFASTVAASTE